MGRWILEKLQVYSPYSGVTSNQSESFNVVLKRLQSWREVPVDVIVLSLFHLHAYYNNEIQRGFSGLGNYLLAPEFVTARRTEDEIAIIPTYSPSDIVSRMKECVEGVHETDNVDHIPMEVDLDEKDHIPAKVNSEAVSLLSTQHSRARLVYYSNNHVTRVLCFVCAYSIAQVYYRPWKYQSQPKAWLFHCTWHYWQCSCCQDISYRVLHLRINISTLPYHCSTNQSWSRE